MINLSRLQYRKRYELLQLQNNTFYDIAEFNIALQYRKRYELLQPDVMNS